MNDDELIEQNSHDLKVSIEFFSSKNKPERERWVCKSFLETLGVQFEEAELSTPPSDPPDVLFRDGKFEIKEILDAGRHRHQEYKMLLERSLQATDAQELLEEYTPQEMTYLQLVERVVSEAASLDFHYAPAVRKELDLLFYVNLKELFFIEDGQMPAANAFARFGWRSVSAFENSAAFVFFAAPDAPSFLHPFVGTFFTRKAE